MDYRNIFLKDIISKHQTGNSLIKYNQNLAITFKTCFRMAVLSSFAAVSSAILMIAKYNHTKRKVYKRVYWISIFSILVFKNLSMSCLNQLGLRNEPTYKEMFKKIDFYAYALLDEEIDYEKK